VFLVGVQVIVLDMHDELPLDASDPARTLACQFASSGWFLAPSDVDLPGWSPTNTGLFGKSCHEVELVLRGRLSSFPSELFDSAALVPGVHDASVLCAPWNQLVSGAVAVGPQDALVLVGHGSLVTIGDHPLPDVLRVLRMKAPLVPLVVMAGCQTVHPRAGPLLVASQCADLRAVIVGFDRVCSASDDFHVLRHLPAVYRAVMCASPSPSPRHAVKYAAAVCACRGLGVENLVFLNDTCARNTTFESLMDAVHSRMYPGLEVRLTKFAQLHLRSAGSRDEVNEFIDMLNEFPPRSFSSVDGHLRDLEVACHIPKLSSMCQSLDNVELSLPSLTSLLAGSWSASEVDDAQFARGMSLGLWGVVSKTSRAATGALSNRLARCSDSGSVVADCLRAALLGFEEVYMSRSGKLIDRFGNEFGRNVQKEGNVKVCLDVSQLLQAPSEDVARLLKVCEAEC
jgi:hypothetical protein